MKREQLEYKIERIKKFVIQNRYTIEEFYEMEEYLKEIQPTWEGCPSCQGKVSFGKVLLKERLITLEQQLNNFEEELLPEEINEPELKIETEPKVELPPVPQGEIKVTTKCKKCQQKNKTGM